MLRRFHALYLRYAAVHTDRLRSAPLGPPWRRFGQVEKVEKRGDRVEITGWARADSLRLTWNGGSVARSPDVLRPDVASRRGGDPEVGFELSVPVSARPLQLVAERLSRADFAVDIAHPSDPAPRRAHRRLHRAFLRDILRATPEFVRYTLAPNDRNRRAIKRAMRLDVSVRGHLLEPAWLTGPAPATRQATNLTIIVPIHNALDMVEACLQRIERNTEPPWHLIAIDDASTDPGLTDFLNRWAGRQGDRVTIMRLRRNLGFVGAVNIGLECAERSGRAGPVILLNSDAMVPPGWAERLIAPLRSPDVASVTPMSNAAEILSVPAMGPGLELRSGEGELVDAVARELGAVPSPDLPTGVGFCMAISPGWLARVPRLDPAFGRGYGEEVDWCQKTRALGARHVAQPGLFVEHLGGQSFGIDEKAARLRSAGSLIVRRYPGYDADVQRFMASDPLVTPRLALGVALAAARTGNLAVFLAHTLGGGAEIALRTEVAQRNAAVILRVGGPVRWQIEVHVDGQCAVGQTEDLELIRRLLAPAPALDLIYSCGVGDRDPISLPAAMLSLRRRGRPDGMAMRVHDYFALSPSYTLLGQEGFTGVPKPGDTDPAHRAERPDGRIVDLAQWRAAWGALVAECDEIRAFSRASADLVRAAFPGAPIVVRPHRTSAPVRPVVSKPGAGSVGVLGNLNRQKGAHILRRIAETNPDRGFVVIGLSDSAISLPRNVTIHGAYQPNDISDLAERYGVSGWLMPAIWPETFSFATREALATGLPVAGFDLGAQGEALRHAANGHVTPLVPHGDASARLLALLDAAAVRRNAAE